MRCPCRIVVSTLRCGRRNLGSNPSTDKLFIFTLIPRQLPEGLSLESLADHKTFILATTVLDQRCQFNMIGSRPIEACSPFCIVIRGDPQCIKRE